MQLREIKNIFHKELDDLYGEREVASFFYMLIEHFLGLQRFVLAMEPNLVVDKGQETPMFKALSELKGYKPVQYIIGSAHFMDMTFKVGPAVLIPRPETEELVRWVLSDVGEIKDIRLKVLDLGAGSGCISVALAKNLKMAEVTGVDISDEAIEIAKKNALENGVEVEFLKSDMLTLTIKEKYDIIVSNPPYVRCLEKNKMKENVIYHEPELALYVSDEDSLVFYRAIANFSEKSLKTDGILYLEINQYLGKETVDLFEKHNFKKVELRKDMFGNDRMIKVVK
ncbi:peptide chain release factor N(5)-glutamine methyltransferase [Maribacter sp. MMG018]|uniref:peptide chain release factor N(5)-glutamine methyltransferase n=1 Tax=Maribacter sp. MMG018 TaxID=2822688 RepID=UPI001B37591F|nr:peptide chain release factor N(5)-glutamine methyltransferase [Maribacter sp. MMG018]MBQ4914899.1 peptide chain release factor N(5)-glutamine methyltransferase [Maribacter sp. MMG018]